MDSPASAPRSEPLAGAARLAVILLAVLASAAAIVQMATILQPLAIALFLYFLIKPAAEALIRFHLPPWAAYLLLLLIAFALSAAVGNMVYRNAIAFRAAWDPELVKNAGPPREKLHEQPNPAPPQGAEPLANPPAAEAENVVGLKALLRKKLVEQAWIDEETFSSTFDFTLRDTFGYLFDATFHMAELGLMSFFYLTFFILDRHKFAHRVERAFEPEQANHLLEVGRQINTGLEQYIQVKTLISGGMGLSSAVILYFFGVPYWVLWAFLFFALNYITYVGSIAACVPPVVVTLLHYPSPWVAVWLLVVLVVHRLIWIDFLEIRMSGKELNLDSILMLLSLAFWGWAWGVVGLVLSVPILTTVKIVLAHIKETEGVAELISGD